MIIIMRITRKITRKIVTVIWIIAMTKALITNFMTKSIQLQIII